ncbi:hypothetical protein F9C07_5337 [Aspergillus flavus]|uniref:Cyanovirin-N domain-containing protein n=2 Tax=Aspergillus flavus TaxID=5059 RepID=A0A7U2R061_ASPFN|nr:hypothetical protein AFLA_007564 [Aspergillus flavus NRRL3357]QRD91288.1 hypothetical protein F9C07_5337 [Aspergillus flavus]RAQ59765.1 hypothetical protein COH20_002150 [Aspergillus flavus]RAQ79827.1 hypothetical protein COH21_006163 [Aspergillus flavus]RMZ45931.1 hypothetical protein CA14_005714 [Aspergillus flavus]
MRLLLPFIVLPLATLAVPPPHDVPAVNSVAALRLAELNKPKGDFIRSCKDVKLDGKKDDMHELIATCAAGDGTEITSKLDLSYCFSSLSAGGNNVNPKKADDATCSKCKLLGPTLLECICQRKPGNGRTIFLLDQELWNDHGYLRCEKGKGQRI